METVTTGCITVEAGLDGDFKGAKYRNRQLTVLAAEDWRAAVEDLGMLEDLAGPVPMPWTLRRANLLVSGIRLPRAVSARLAVGSVVMEVTGQTYPCRRMEEARPGLLKALAKDWRGGVTCRVVTGGAIRLGDDVRILSSPAERRVRLPG